MRWIGNVQLVAGTSADVPRVLSLIADSGISVEGNPDLYVRAYGAFGIDEAREIGAKASLRAFGNNRRIFVLAADTITAEAQNALLKTLEEPGGDSVFFIVTPVPAQLLVTVRSRAQLLPLDSERRSTAGAEEFFAAPVAARLEMLKPLLEKGEQDRRDIAAVISFLSALEAYAAEYLPHPAARSSVRAILRARAYLGDRGALVKPLLEQVALLVERPGA